MEAHDVTKKKKLTKNTFTKISSNKKFTKSIKKKQINKQKPTWWENALTKNVHYSENISWKKLTYVFVGEKKVYLSRWSFSKKIDHNQHLRTPFQKYINRSIYQKNENKFKKTVYEPWNFFLKKKKKLSRIFFYQFYVPCTATEKIFPMNKYFTKSASTRKNSVRKMSKTTTTTNCILLLFWKYWPKITHQEFS